MKKFGVSCLVLLVLISALGLSCAQTTQRGVYDYEWYQAPVPNEEEKAYLEFWTQNAPVKLRYYEDDADYKWNIEYGFQEINGIDFHLERITEVFFNADHEITDVYVSEGDVLAFYWENAMIPGGMGSGHNMYRPVSGDCGYGVSFLGTDAKGNELAFGFYVPLSQEIEKIYEIEELRAAAQKQESQAFLPLTPISNPAPLLIEDANFGGENGWFYGFSVENKSDVAFTALELIEQFFDQDACINKLVYSADQMTEWGAPAVYQTGDTWQLMGGMREQDVDAVGYVLRGTDANGNELEFMTCIELERK